MGAYKPITKFGNTFANRKGVGADASGFSDTLGDIDYEAFIG